MLRRLVVIASVLVLVVAVALAATRGGASYTRGDVVRAFARQGFTLSELPPVKPGMSPGGTFFFPGPSGQGAFYVLVARSDGYTDEFVRGLTPGPGAFDLRSGNVVVSSDASLSETGLMEDERRRIRTAMDSLGDETPLSAATFRAAANELCRRAVEESLRVPDRAKAKTADELEDLDEETKHHLARYIAAFEDLTPPLELQTKVNAWLSANREAAEHWANFLDASREGDPEEVGAKLVEVRKDTEGLNRLGESLRLSECVVGGGWTGYAPRASG